MLLLLCLVHNVYSDIILSLCALENGSVTVTGDCIYCDVSFPIGCVKVFVLDCFIHGYKRCLTNHFSNEIILQKVSVSVSPSRCYASWFLVNLLPSRYVWCSFLNLLLGFKLNPVSLRRDI